MNQLTISITQKMYLLKYLYLYVVWLAMIYQFLGNADNYSSDP